MAEGGTVGSGAADTSAAAIPAPREGAAPAREIDQDRLDGLLGQVIGDLGAAVTVPLVRLGDKLGLFQSMAGTGSVSADELAERTGLSARYVQEWLLAMAASGYVDYKGDGQYELSPEQAELFANPDSPAYVAGGFQNMTAAVRSQDRLADAFRTGDGMGWHEHHPDMFEGTERFFRPGYLANLTSSWIPSLPGLEAQLQQGGRIADVGCGLGASTRIMADSYPAATLVGIDYHDASVEQAREKAAAAGLSDRVTFEQAGAQELTGEYDLITFFDCLHDMPDPLSALQSARAALREEGWVMLVEPISGDMVEDVLNPVGRLFAGASVLICLPSGLSAEPRAGLGNQAGPVKTLALAEQAGFSRVQEATRTPFNIIYGLQR
ncbi:MAG: rebM2 [Frankiales bacterium]|jgi:2-polyprenyl-3-methyl-5-hydroxy-6-metoxy-1,4-benzoquinol methylase|nr:rebM2 [Frankiales bacterium]